MKTKNRHNGHYHGNGKQKHEYDMLIKDRSIIFGNINYIKFKVTMPDRLRNIEVENIDPKVMLKNMRTWMRCVLSAYNKNIITIEESDYTILANSCRKLRYTKLF